jgi:hypothetical protein
VCQDLATFYCRASSRQGIHIERGEGEDLKKGDLFFHFFLQKTAVNQLFRCEIFHRQKLACFSKCMGSCSTFAVLARVLCGGKGEKTKSLGIHQKDFF